MASIAKLLVILRDEDDSRLPGPARFALTQFAEQIELLTIRIEKLDREILGAARKDPNARRLITAPGVGPLIAATVRTSVSDGATSQPLGLSKRGNRQLRTLWIAGATSIIKLAKRGLKDPLWVEAMLQRRPVKVVSVALANKIARRCSSGEASIRRRPLH